MVLPVFPPAMAIPVSALWVSVERTAKRVSQRCLINHGVYGSSCRSQYQNKKPKSHSRWSASDFNRV